MEKDEKIQQDEYKRSRYFGWLLTVLLLGLGGALVWTTPLSETESSTTTKQQNDKVRRQQEEGVVSSSSSSSSEAELVAQVKQLDKLVRIVKANVTRHNKFMETDPVGVQVSRQLQDATRQLIQKRYGATEPYRVKVDVQFQPSNPTYNQQSPNTDSFVIEMAPISLMPHAVYSFLEIARYWPLEKGAFHRRAGHVLQVLTRGHAVKELAFQEYSPDFPHRRGTVGYAGRPSGPHWYVSIQDNTKNHGPGSQQKRNPHEADACFGKIVQGFDNVIMGRITKMPGTGFLKQPAHVLIESMTILVPASSRGGGSNGDDFVPWIPTEETPPINT